MEEFVMKVCIVGAGTMGRGIAQVFAAQDSNSVYLCDLTEELAAGGKERILHSLAHLVKKGTLPQEQVQAISDRIITGTISIASDADLVIEAVKEDCNVKKETFRQLEEIVPKNCMFASNTSSLSVTEISKGLDRPVIGMHFFNPAPVMKLVEIVRGELSSDSQVEQAKQIAVSIGKIPIEIKESAGFAVNRILAPMLNEAAYELYEGIATREDIDQAMVLGTNMPMGPLRLADYVGLDICLAALETLQFEFGNPKYSPCPLIRKLVRAGKLGVKTGEGFYNYRSQE
jgi:3-hydroxybutyryl-CoA dehydrogenase